MQGAGVLLVALWLVSGAEQAIAGGPTFDAETVGKPGSNAPAELFLPAGIGPSPAMVVLHGCDGVGRHYREWARELAGRGYIALLVDSFRPRRFTRLTNGFSKKYRNHVAAVSLYVAHVNLCRVHEALRMTPGLAVMATDHVWSVAELVEVALSVPDDVPLAA